MWSFHVVVLQRTVRGWPKVRATRAARLFFLDQSNRKLRNALKCVLCVLSDNFSWFNQCYHNRFIIFSFQVATTKLAARITSWSGFQFKASRKQSCLLRITNTHIKAEKNPSLIPLVVNKQTRGSSTYASDGDRWLREKLPWTGQKRG